MVRKVNMAASISAVTFRFDLIVSSFCTVWLVSSQCTRLFLLYLHPEASRAMYSSVFCSVFQIHSQIFEDKA